MKRPLDPISLLQGDLDRRKAARAEIETFHQRRPGVSQARLAVMAKLIEAGEASNLEDAYRKSGAPRPARKPSKT